MGCILLVLFLLNPAASHFFFDDFILWTSVMLYNGEGGVSCCSLHKYLVKTVQLILLYVS